MQTLKPDSAFKVIKPTNDLCFLNNLFQNVCGKYAHIALCWLQAHVFKLKTSVCLKLSNIHVYSEVFSGSLPSRVACLQVLVCAFSCSSWSSQGNEFPWCQQSAFENCQLIKWDWFCSSGFIRPAPAPASQQLSVRCPVPYDTQRVRACLQLVSC